MFIQTVDGRQYIVREEDFNRLHREHPKITRNVCIRVGIKRCKDYRQLVNSLKNLEKE